MRHTFGSQLARILVLSTVLFPLSAVVWLTEGNAAFQGPIEKVPSTQRVPGDADPEANPDEGSDEKVDKYKSETNKPISHPVPRPDLAVGGSEAGKSKFSLGLAIWFLQNKQEQKLKEWAASSQDKNTFIWLSSVALDIEAEVEGGFSRLLALSNEESSQEVSASRWGASVSYGGTRLPLSVPIAEILSSDQAARAEALQICASTCDENPNSSGCKPYTESRKLLQMAHRAQLLRETLDSKDETEASIDQILVEGEKREFLERLDRSLAGSGKECRSQSKKLRRRVELEFTHGMRPSAGTEDSWTKEMVEALRTCSLECPTTTPPAGEDGEKEAFCTDAEILCATLPPNDPKCDIARNRCESRQPVVSTPDQCEKMKSDLMHMSTPLNWDQNTLGVDAMCDQGRDHYEDITDGLLGEARHARVPSYRAPPFSWSAGLRASANPRDFLRERNSGILVDGVEQPRFRKKSVVVFGLSAGGKVGHVGARGLTVEARALYKYLPPDEVDIAKWCTIPGYIDEGVSPAAIQICDTAESVAPQQEHEAQLDLQLGWADTSSFRTRFSVGPRYRVENGDDPIHRIGANVPISVLVTKQARDDRKIDFDGIVRITPFFEQVVGTSEEHYSTTVGLLLELLAKRGLFSAKFDEF